MDDDDFDDLFAEDELFQDSSQESLTIAAAGLGVFDDLIDDVQRVEEPPECNATRTTMNGAFSTRPEDILQASVVGSPIVNDLGDPARLPRTAISSDASSVGHPPNISIMDKIERIFANIAADVLDEKKQISVMIKRQTRNQQNIVATPFETGAPDHGFFIRRVCFPGKNSEEAWRFTVIIRILELVYEALRSGTVMSKRDIYYRDPALFGNQTHVNQYIDTIAYTFDVPRSMLNVTGVPTGIVTGALIIYRRDGSSINVAEHREGSLVPNSPDILSVDLKSAKWILVVEKAASFRSIAASSLWTDISSHAVLITGKGYPDISTRAFLRLISEPSPRNGFATPPVFGLMDFDPDGLAIFGVYKQGSAALAHENHDLRAPRLQWVGLKMEGRFLADTTLHAAQGLLTLTPRDRRKAVTMLERVGQPDTGGDDCEISQALQQMLMLNTKAELQLLDAHPDGMAEFLKEHVCL